MNKKLQLLCLSILLVVPVDAQVEVAQVKVEKARQADAFVETIGLGGRYDWMFGHGELDNAKSVLQKTRIRYIRSAVVGEGADQDAYGAAMKAMMEGLQVKMCGLVGWSHPGETRAAVERLGPTLYALEGINEAWERPWGWTGWGNSLDVQKFIWELGRTKNLDVYSWTLGGPINSYLLPEFADAYRQTNAWSTHANFHPYHWYSNPGGRGITKINGLWQDSETPDQKGGVSTLRRLMGDPHKPLVATEWGWSYEEREGDPYPVSEEARAKFYTRGLLENFNAGLERAFIYSINSNLAYNIRDGAALRPSGQAIADLIALTQDRGPAFPTKTLNFSLVTDSGLPTTDDHDLRNDEIHHSLLQKRDGSFVLILWADKDSHLGDTASEAATLVLPDGAAQLRFWKPLSHGTKILATRHTTNSDTAFRLAGELAIPDHPLLIEITFEPQETSGAPNDGGK